MTARKAMSAVVGGTRAKGSKAGRGLDARKFSPQGMSDRRIGNAATVHERQECAAVLDRRVFSRRHAVSAVDEKVHARTTPAA
jgi:hypothetical protein